MSRIFITLACVFALLTAACAASVPPAAEELDPDSDSDMAAASPSGGDRATAMSEPGPTMSDGTSSSSGGSATVFRTPKPLLDAVPGIPVGRALSARGDVPDPGMVRLAGLVQTGAKSPAPRVCVTLGPPLACAVLTDGGGKWEIDVPQGDISWEFHFIRSGREVGPKVVIRGPFAGSPVAVETVTVR